MRSRLCLLLGSAVLVGVAAPACGDASSTTRGAVATPAALTGDLTVFAAASLTESFADVRATLQAAHPALSIRYSFAGSQQLVGQIESGAPADVVATADAATMQRLRDAGLVETPSTFARNTLEIAVAPGNPKGIRGLADLARRDLRVVLADPAVPAGRYGRQALERLGVTVSPVSRPLDVRTELLDVEQGGADAGIVYVTDVSAAGPAVTGVPIPAGENVVATYPIAVVAGSEHMAAARAFVAAVLDGVGRAALRARGFLAP